MNEERTVWSSLNTIHGVVYFHPDAAKSYKELGLRGYWSGYFASRAAALGTPSARVVTALFHGFAPTKVARAIPEAWDLANPSDVLKVRLSLARDALGRFLPDTDFSAPADELSDVVADLDFAGKALAAAHADIAVSDDPLDRLWHAATVLREYRGDIHIGVLNACRLNGAEANALQVAVGNAPKEKQKERGWDDESWSNAVDRLITRGWVDAEGNATDAGREQREEIEILTDEASSSTISRLSTDTSAALTAMAAEIAEANAAAG
ncbi:MAG TPA: hypothetical protein VFC57_01425 [Aeromicrobium sp.]|nr:hypothetical protein [Aeromicrobium sp.]